MTWGAFGAIHRLELVKALIKRSHHWGVFGFWFLGFNEAGIGVGGRVRRRRRNKTHKDDGDDCKDKDGPPLLGGVFGRRPCPKGLAEVGVFLPQIQEVIDLMRSISKHALTWAAEAGAERSYCIVRGCSIFNHLVDASSADVERAQLLVVGHELVLDDTSRGHILIGSGNEIEKAARHVPLISQQDLDNVEFVANVLDLHKKVNLVEHVSGLLLRIFFFLLPRLSVFLTFRLSDSPLDTLNLFDTTFEFAEVRYFVIGLANSQL